MSTPKYAENTEVPVERSRAEIEQLLRRHGASQFGSASDEEKGLAWIVFRMGERMYRLEVRRPTPDPFPRKAAPEEPELRAAPGGYENTFRRTERERINGRLLAEHEARVERHRRDEAARSTRWVEQEERRRWRAQLLLVKAKLEMVGTGETSVEREFLADMLTANGQTLARQLAPVIARMYETGKMPTTLLLGSGPSDDE